MNVPPHMAPLGETLTRRQKWLLLASLMTAMFMGAIDQSIMATAAPKIVANLGNFQLLSWVFTTYMLTSTVVVPLAGKLSDIYGRKRFLLGGIALFVAASAACGAAPNMLALIVARGVQGVGGGIVFSSVFATIGDIFSPAERGKYMGLFTGTFSLASVLGPTLGGLLTDTAGWRWIFYINVPIGAVALLAIGANLPLRRNPGRVRIDYAGALYLSVATTGGLLALAWSGEANGWSAGSTLALFALCLAALALFVRQEKRHPEPIIPFQLFRNREFLLGNLIVLTTGLAMMGVMPYVPTFLQVALDASATASGLITTPQSAGMLTASIIGGQLMSRTGRYKKMMVLGTLLMLTAMALMLTLTADSPAWHLSAFVILLGLGGGLTMPVMSVVIQNAVPQQFMGVATSSRQFFMQIGGVAGAAVFGVLLAASFQSQFRQEIPDQTRAAVPAATLARFEDPTLALDPRGYTQVQAAVRALPEGEALLASARRAQQLAITAAIHRLFIISVVLMGVAVLLTTLLRDRPLRRTPTPPSAPPAEPQPAVPSAISH